MIIVCYTATGGCGKWFQGNRDYDKWADEFENTGVWAFIQSCPAGWARFVRESECCIPRFT